MMGAEMASDSTPTAINVPVTNNEKLSATTTPKLAAWRSQSRIAEAAAPTSPIRPSGPIGMRSPGERKASAVMAAMAAAVTQAMGTTALKEANMTLLAHPDLDGHTAPRLVQHPFDRRSHRPQKQIRQHPHQHGHRQNRHDDRPFARLQIGETRILLADGSVVDPLEHPQHVRR